MKGQGALEYLILLAGVLAVAGLAVLFLTSTAQTAAGSQVRALCNIAKQECNSARLVTPLLDCRNLCQQRCTDPRTGVEPENNLIAWCNGEVGIEQVGAALTEGSEEPLGMVDGNGIEMVFVLADIDDDGVEERVEDKRNLINNTYFDGYETYIDNDGSSRVSRYVDGDGDGLIDLLIDTDLDDWMTPEIYWDPDDNIITQVTKQDENNYLIDTDNDGNPDRIFTFGKVKYDTRRMGFLDLFFTEDQDRYLKTCESIPNTDPLTCAKEATLWFSRIGGNTILFEPFDLDIRDDPKIKMGVWTGDFNVVEKTKNKEQIKEYVDYAHSLGLEVWIIMRAFENSYWLKSHPEDKEQTYWERIQDPAFESLTQQQQQLVEPADFVTPGSDEYWDEMKRRIQILFTDFEFDGLRYDYIRYPYYHLPGLRGELYDVGYNQKVIDKYISEFADEPEEHNPLTSSAERTSGSWVQFRRRLVGDRVAEMTQLVEQITSDRVTSEKTNAYVHIRTQFFPSPMYISTWGVESMDQDINGHWSTPFIPFYSENILYQQGGTAKNRYIDMQGINDECKTSRAACPAEFHSGFIEYLLPQTWDDPGIELYEWGRVQAPGTDEFNAIARNILPFREVLEDYGV